MARKIFLVPIEPFEERYSIDWFNWFKEHLAKFEIPYEVISPKNPLTEKIETGEFLDVYGTNHYKAQQLQILCEKLYTNDIQNNDLILFLDYWFPGVEMLQYIRSAIGTKFKIAGLLHAGTWDPNDYLARKGMGKWAKPIEASWLNIADLLFVATNFHKNMICNYFALDLLNPDKIKVTGFPIYLPETIKKEKKDTQSNLLDYDLSPTIVFPHRLAPEKRPELFDLLIKKSKEQLLLLKDCNFLRTKDIYTTKELYYKTLLDSDIAVSFALQETWGIAMQEAALANCIPLVPDRLSYSELFPQIFKFYGDVSVETTEIQNLLNKLKDVVTRSDVYLIELQNLKASILLKGQSAIPNILAHCLDYDS